MSANRIGVLFDRDRAPEELAAFAAGAEQAGADDLWVVEDLGWAGSISSAAIALAATRHLRVGIGIAPVALRNPALLAMELATLARAFPGRLVAGLGHGVAEWMRQVGAEAGSKLALLEESIVAVRGLLSGETVVLKGREVTVDGLRLVFPPAEVPPLVTGVVGPKSLELSGRVADGTILADGVGPERLAVALAAIGPGRATGERPGHELIVFTDLHLEEDPRQAGAATAEPAELFTMIGSGDAVPDRLAALRAAGADTIVLRPVGADPLGQLRLALAALNR